MYVLAKMGVRLVEVSGLYYFRITAICNAMRLYKDEADDYHYFEVRSMGINGNAEYNVIATVTREGDIVTCA